MHFVLVTQVAEDHHKVFEQFDSRLLKALSPPGMKMKVIRYDEPHEPGSIVELEATLYGLIKQHWKNEITEVEHREEANWFVDKGLKLPWPVKSWQHKHLIRAATTEDGRPCTEIVDDITYDAGWITRLVHPVIWFQFAYRKPQYRKLFGAVK